MAEAPGRCRRPDLAVDAQPEEVFAGEALLDELHGVDFQKGCFVGQENVSRMKRRATTRRKFCPLQFEGEAPPFGTPVVVGEAEIGRNPLRPGRAGAGAIAARPGAGSSGAGPDPCGRGRVAKLDPPPWLILPAAGA